MKLSKILIITGSIGLFLSVLLGAFGTHSLKDILDEYNLGLWEKAVYYQNIHSLALIISGIIQNVYKETNLKLSGFSFMAGILLFCGSLFAIALSNIKAIGMVTPFGGLFFLLGWGSIIYQFFKNNN